MVSLILQDIPTDHATVMFTETTHTDFRSIESDATCASDAALCRWREVATESAFERLASAAGAGLDSELRAWLA